MTIKKTIKYSEIRVNDIVTGGRIVTEVSNLDDLVSVKFNDGSSAFKHKLTPVEIER